MRIHLDHAATTPVRGEVAETVAEVHALGLGNPSSLHQAGRRARRLLDDARDEVADLLGAHPGEVVFTSGGTESDDLAVNGVAAARPGAVMCSAVEHDAVLGPVKALGERGQVVGVDGSGRVMLEDLERRIIECSRADGVALVSVLLVNNENGVRHDLDAIAEIVRRSDPDAYLHTDAVQAAGWLDLRAAARSADLISVSGHKIGAPVGIGALVVREGVSLAARMVGGGQEHERRSGTQNVAGAVALARAMRLASAERADVVLRVTGLRERLKRGILGGCPGAVVPAEDDGFDDDRITGGTIQFCLPGVESEALLFVLDEAGVEASAGSACAAGALETSHVLAAMGVDDDLAAGALRLSVGRTTTEAEIDAAIGIVTETVARLCPGHAA